MQVEDKLEKEFEASVSNLVSLLEPGTLVFVARNDHSALSVDYKGNWSGKLDMHGWVVRPDIDCILEEYAIITDWICRKIYGIELFGVELVQVYIRLRRKKILRSLTSKLNALFAAQEQV